MNVPHQTQVHDYASIRRRIARQIESLCDSLCITRTTAIDAILRAKWNEENATSQVLQVEFVRNTGRMCDQYCGAVRGECE
jgi:hypothetical protein